MTAPLPREIIRLSDLPARRTSEITLEPDAAGRAAIAEALGIQGVRKFRFTVTLRPTGGADWQLDGQLGVTVVQSCVVTLAPVSTRIEERVTRSYLAHMDMPEGGTEVEMPEDETAEPLPETVDLYTVALEALALALPPYPRAADAELGEAVYAEPGVTPMRDEEARPFAGLAGLRDALGGTDDGDDGQGGEKDD